ncbi:hypothetical protein HPG69_016380 [Diceros bicornis minor]|uniref:F5/8 type C domain-containing protein n=1 Tax=Diceros bicornis minor TaxID=77932 RepID=A0A7J7EF37_DICBM|nr:hypothetical protein HPG69_016380 [Diceros bicornis minor]
MKLFSLSYRSSTLNARFPLLPLVSSGAGGWSPSDGGRYQWLQVEFGDRKQISAVATQGRYSSSDWVTQYRMLYSDTGRNWKPYHQDGNIWNFFPNVKGKYMPLESSLKEEVFPVFLALIDEKYPFKTRCHMRRHKHIILKPVIEINISNHINTFPIYLFYFLNDKKLARLQANASKVHVQMQGKSKMKVKSSIGNEDSKPQMLDYEQEPVFFDL